MYLSGYDNSPIPGSLLERGILTFEMIDRARIRIQIGEPFWVDGETRRLRGTVETKYKFFFTVRVPDTFKLFCIQYVDLLTKAK